MKDFVAIRPSEARSLMETQKALRHFLKIAIQMTRADSGSFILHNPNTGLLDIEASYGLSKRAQQIKLRPGQGVTGWVATTGLSARIADVRLERKYVSVNPRIRSEMAVPLEWKGQVIGILNLDSRTVAHFGQAEEDQLKHLATEAAEWLTYTWEVQKMRMKDQQLTTLLEMGRRIVSQMNLDEVLARIARDAARLMKAEVSSLRLLSPDKKELILRAGCGTSLRYQKQINLSVEDSLVGVAVNRRRPMAVLNVQVDPRYQHVEMARRDGLFSLLAVPLMFSPDMIGVLSVYKKEIHRFSNDEIKLLQALADLSAVAIEKTRLMARVVDTEETLRQSERLSALGLLATEVAHEIRNPLTVMQMLFHGLAATTPMNEATRKDATIIEEKMKHMNRILDQVLNLVRSAEPTLRPIHIGPLLDDISLLIRHKLFSLKVEVRRQIAVDLPVLWADRAQLEQAILNLVLNAGEAMPNGGTLWLGANLEAIDDTNYVVLSVRDNGHGMSKKGAESLFAPFLTNKPQGTGIGMAIVRRILENHQGKIQVVSRLGKGTKIKLFLPIRDL